MLQHHIIGTKIARRIQQFFLHKQGNNIVYLLILPLIFLGAFSLNVSNVHGALDGVGSDLVGWWKLNEGSLASSTDSTGNGHTGTVTGNPTYVAGQLNGAISFDANDDKIAINDFVEADGTTTLTVSAWVQPSVAASTSALTIVSKTRTLGGFTGWALSRNTSEKYSFYVSGATTGGTASSDSVFADTSMHHIVGVYNGVDVRVYVDGVSADTTPVALTEMIPAGTQKVCIGQTNGGAGICDGAATTLFAGMIDDVRIYNRALSATEVGQLYDNGIAGIETVVAPTVTTQDASSITSTTITANGNITSTGGDPVTTRGFAYGLTTQYGATTTDSGSFGTGAYTASVSDLTCNTLYHIRSYAINSLGTSFGSDSTFTTATCAATIPSITTSVASSITPTSTILNGSITDTGNENPTIRGFNWGTTVSYGATSTESGSFDVGSFSTTTTGLSCNTIYHFRAYATNSGGIGYGTDITATTSSCDPTVTSFTIPATAASTTISITSFTGTDDIEITGYLLTEIATTSNSILNDWSESVPVSYVFRTAGHQSLYAWVKDADGNISEAVRDDIYISLPSYTLPKGVPDPGFGLSEALPSRPSPWTSAQSGYYYVDYHGTCTDTSNTYGYPGNARCSIPNPITKGSYIEIKGTYDRSSGGVNNILTSTDSTKPNGNAWIANVDGPAWITMIDTDSKFSGNKMVVRGSYIFFDNIVVDSSTLQIGTSATLDGYEADHIVVRNSIFTGDESTQENAMAILGNASTSVDHIVIYNNTISNYGNMLDDADQDLQAISFGPYTTYSWALGNTIHTMSNTSMFAGGQFGSSPLLTRYVYMAGNHIQNVRAGGISVKNITDVIISENYVHNIIDTNWSEGKCFGAQYSPQNYWLIFNKCNHSRYGLKIASTDTGTWNMYVVGNLFYDIHWQYRCTYTGCATDQYDGTSSYDEAAIAFWGGTNLYAVNNTIYDISSGIISPTRKNIFLENNIIADINDSNGHHVWINDTQDAEYVRNNLIHQNSGTWRIGWGGSTKYLSLVSFQSGTSQCSGCTSSSPLFVNAINYADLNLQNVSVAKDAGLAPSSLTSNIYDTFFQLYTINIEQDYLGISRPQDSAWDIGAYEYSSGIITSPYLTTVAPSSVATSTLTLNANISATGNASITQSGFAYGTVSNLTTVIATTSLGAQSTGDFSGNLTGLTPNTIYYFRAYAVNSAGTSTGAILSTTTLATAIPTVTTQSVSSITQTTATGNGNITATGNINPTARGVVYGASTAYGATTTSSGDFSTGAFTSSITGLTCNTTYHITAYATNSEGTAYGSDTTFTTSACDAEPTPTTVTSSYGSGSSGFIRYLPANPIIYFTPSPQVTTADDATQSTTIKPTVLPPQTLSLFQTLSPEFTTLVNKFPELGKTLISLASTTKGNITAKLQNIKIPGLSSTVGSPTGIPISSLTPTQKQSLPTEVVFAKSGDIIDYNVAISVSNTGTVEQTIHTVSGKAIDLALKPAKPVKSITGYLTVKNIPRIQAMRAVPASMMTASIGSLLTQSIKTPPTVDTKLVLQTFTYTDPDKDGIYTAHIDAPLIHGEYDVMTIMEYKDNKLGAKEFHLTTVVDPEGYVYVSSKNGKTRIENATVSLIQKDPKSSTYSPWQASKFKQVNPQKTDDTGAYSFLVPEGTYKLTVTASGYNDFVGQEFQVVQGSGVHENIEMKKKGLLSRILNWLGL